MGKQVICIEDMGKQVICRVGMGKAAIGIRMHVIGLVTMGK
jgi:hypothetical protein